MDWFPSEIPFTAALAAVAAIGYFVGRRGRAAAVAPEVLVARRELKRARNVIRQLERIAEEIRGDLAVHRTSVAEFKSRIGRLAGEGEEIAWQELCTEAERMLKPTMRLTTQISHAYDELRQQMNLLMTFTEIHTDPLTGLSNRRALEESLAAHGALWERYGSRYSILVIDIDHFKPINDQFGHLYGDRMLCETARVLEAVARDTDVVARYGGEEFVFVLPQTEAAGASELAERVRREVQEQTSLTVSLGVAQSLTGQAAAEVFSRADEAMYAAKAAGRNRVFLHNGEICVAVETEEHFPLPV